MAQRMLAWMVYIAWTVGHAQSLDSCAYLNFVGVKSIGALSSMNELVLVPDEPGVDVAFGKVSVVPRGTDVKHVVVTCRNAGCSMDNLMSCLHDSGQTSAMLACMLP